MKNLLLTLVTFSVLLLIGCQENSITDPIQETASQKTDNTSNLQTIKLTGLLRDPYPIFNSYYRINGTVQYQHSIEFVDPIPPNPQIYVSLNISLNADFTYFCSVCDPSQDDQLKGFISEVSEEFIPMADNDRGVMLEKIYAINDRDDGMVLKCRFLVTTIDIELIGMWLEISEDDQTNDGINETLN